MNNLLPVLAALVSGTVCLWAQVERLDAPKVTHQVVATGPHERMVRTLTPSRGPSGEQTILTNSYVQLETGLNVWSEKDQAWVESSPAIELLDTGAVARGTQHKVSFTATLDDPAGAVLLVMPDGQHMRIRVLGLALTDARDPSKSALIAEPVKGAQGYLVGENQIVYPDALGPGIDVIYTVTRWGLEQDLALKTRITDPAELALDAANVEVWSEVLDGPEPKATEDPRSVDWGSMHLGLGRAFVAPEGSGASEPVSAKWFQVEGRRFIVESIPLAAVESMQAELPPAGASLRSERVKGLLAGKASGTGRRIPVTLAAVDSRPREPILAAIRRREFPPRRGIILDWQAVVGTLTNYVFRGNCTYYVSGPTSLTGTNTTFMGGAVIKYAPTNTASLTVNTPLTWLAEPYRPVIMTARDDGSVGESITNATPSGYYANRR